jgi:hypothetical protein
VGGTENQRKQIFLGKVGLAGCAGGPAKEEELENENGRWVGLQGDTGQKNEKGKGI